jgi:hypothetical protein
VKRILLAAVRFYKRRVSPGLPPSCRFQPTCSDYALEAIDRFGAVRGTAMSAWRLVRCNPFNDGGLDPVPERSAKRSVEHSRA